MKGFAIKITLAAALGLALVFAVNAQTVKTSTKCANANNLKEDEITKILDAHNKIRTELGLLKLVWNSDIAAVAQAWATRGVFEHSTSEYGENIFASYDSAVPSVAAVDSWLTEKAFWNNTDGTCQTGKICTHYTQLVWKKTTEIGCGINRNASGKWKVILVCNYSPAGNYDGKPY